MNVSPIRFALRQGPLGQMLLADRGRGACAIALGDDPDALARGLQDDFPEAVLVTDPAGLAPALARLAHAIEHPREPLDLELEPVGTPLQRRVWAALRTVPAGTTVSYAAIARRIGRPEAVRAVANACAANRLAIAIPCHRVVRSDGALSGYRWGVQRKRWLLDREAQS